MPDPPPMAFKGGTSLSKVYRIIDRFSEDVDVTLDYRAFNDGFDPFADAASRNRIRLDAVATPPLQCAGPTGCDLGGPASDRPSAALQHERVRPRHQRFADTPGPAASESSTASARNFKPRAPTTLRTVSKVGLRSPESAL